MSLRKFPRKPLELTKEEKDTIVNYMFNNNLTFEMIARKIGISREQVYNPVSGRRGCSRLSYQKIQKFIKKIYREEPDATKCKSN